MAERGQNVRGRFLRRLGRRFLVLVGGMIGTGLAVSPLAIRGSSGAGLIARIVSARQERISPGAWHSDPGGFSWAPGEGRDGGPAIVCQSDRTGDTHGAFQRIMFKPSTPFPLSVSGWSRAENVDGARDGDYAIYVDVEHEDGTVLRGEVASFACGTHSWEKAVLPIPETKEVRALVVHCLFRGHRGKAWFDGLSVIEEGGGAAVAFQGVSVLMGPPTSREVPDPSRTVASHRGDLSLSWSDNRVSSFKIDGSEIAGSQPSGFLVRDCADRDGFFGFRLGHCPELGLDLERRYIGAEDHLAVEGRLRDLRGRDRAITLVWAIPVDLTGWTWGDDLRRSRPISGRGEFSNVVLLPCGATRTISRYPLAAVFHDRVGLALAVDMDRPSQVRLSYHAGTKQLQIAYDLGLVRDSLASPGRADFRFVLYRFDPAEGFRGALQAYYEIFSSAFAGRCRQAGLWLPFQKAAEIKDWKDFGFAFHEGADDAAFDESHGLLGFGYSEPGAWWMPLPKEAPRTEEEALRVLGERASREDSARAVQTSGMKREDGKPAVLFRSAPWCDGAVFSLNPSPSLPGRPSAASLDWNDAVKERHYGKGASAPLAGEFFDSLEGHQTAELDFDHEHLRHCGVPPSFSTVGARPVLFKAQSTFEYVRWVARDLRSMGRLAFGNGTPRRFGFLMPWLDVAGAEVDWFPEGKFHPTSDEDLLFCRAMSYQKPYLLLINTPYSRLTKQQVEEMFQRALFYGIFPSFFSANAQDNPYWKNASWVERDRALFRKYVPLIRRLHRAGWQPCSLARCDNPRIWIERFGPDGGGVSYLTLLNATDQALSGALTLPHGTGADRTSNLLQGAELHVESERVVLSLAPGEVRLLQILPMSKDDSPAKRP